jgi:hypothetical protein
MVCCRVGGGRGVVCLEGHAGERRKSNVGVYVLYLLDLRARADALVLPRLIESWVLG